MKLVVLFSFLILGWICVYLWYRHDCKKVKEERKLTMFEEFIREDTIPAAYHSALHSLACDGKIVGCSDWNTKCLEMSLTMVIEHPTAEPMISKLAMITPELLEQYRMEMVEGIMDFSVDSGKEPYTYHDRMVRWGGDKTKNQLDFVISELRRNPESRRAVIDIRNNAEEMGEEEIACMQHIQFFIRDGKLDMKVLFRSEDAIRAAFTNIFGLVMLQEYVALCLCVPVGQYTHRVNSFHVYKDCFNDLIGASKRIENEGLKDLTIPYRGENGWAELMAEERENILRKMEALKA